jgi:HEAT repeat protein
MKALRPLQTFKWRREMPRHGIKAIGFALVVILATAFSLPGYAASEKIVKRDATVQELIEVLSKPDPHPKYWNHRRAADLLGARKAEEAVPILIKNLESPNEKAIRACTIALGKIGDPSAVPVLIEHLNGSFLSASNPHVIGDCIIALGRIGKVRPEVRDTIRPHLERYQKEGDQDQVRWASRALGYWSE